MTIAYLNGDYLPLSEARISPMDRGYLFGDGIYEVIPVYNGKPFRLKAHLHRLIKSLDGIRMNVEMTEQDWQGLFQHLIEKNGNGDQSIYLQITRGSSLKRQHILPKEYTPTVFSFSVPLPKIDYTELAKGICAATAKDIRWQYCYIKSTSLLANVLLGQEAVDHQAEETILLRDGFVTEGSSSNVFTVRENTLYTTPLSENILGGITRDVIIELAEKIAIPFEEKLISKNELFTSDEIWVCSSTREIRPVTKLDDTIINNNQVGPIWHKMIDAFQTFKKEY